MSEDQREDRLPQTSRSVTQPVAGRVKQPKRFKRSQKLRSEQNKSVLSNVRKNLDENLFAEYDGLASAFTSLQIAEQKRAVVVPITTRGLGLTIGKLALRINAQLPNLDIPINEWTRVSYAQLEAKLYDASLSQPLPSEDPRFGNGLTTDLRATIGSIAVNLSPVTNIINAVGNFATNDVSYYCGLSSSAPFVPLYSTMRNYVVAATANADQVYSQLACLPGGRWVEQNHLQRLANADEIMPANYTIQNLRTDINAVKAFVATVTRKLPKYNGSIKYGPQGDRSQMISVDTSNRRVNCRVIGDVLTYAGENDYFTTALPLGQQEQTVGMLGLLGEYTVNRPAALASIEYSIRTPYSQARLYAAAWEDIVSAIIA